MISATDMRQAARLAALETELQELGTGVPAATKAKPVTRWHNAKFNGRAPNAIIRKRMARWRMPRELKQDLIERFCATDDPEMAETPSVMIIAAHQDDESIGAGARLCKLTDAFVVHVTDGAPRDPAIAARYGFASREEYAAARRAEAAHAMKVAGLPEDRLICLEYVDGEASMRMVDLVLDVAELIDRYAPDIIITHPYEGGHTDHDSTAFAVHLACGVLRREGIEPPAVLEMTSYYGREGMRIVHDFLPHEGADQEARLLVLSDEEQQTKQRMYDCFTSQKVVISTFSTAMEKFRPAPRYLFTEPPHEGPLNYEKFGDPSRGARWRENAEQALAELRLRKA